MKVDLNDHVVVVTGGAAGIGQAISTAMAANGATVAIVDLPGSSQETVDEIVASGGTAKFFPGDISQRESVDTAKDKIEETFGRIDVLVNNAGTNTPGPLRKNIHEFDVEEWHRILSIDLDGLFYFSRAVAAGMVVRRSGVIVNIASVMGLIPIRLQSPFVTAKAGVINLSRSMALELAQFGIRVNVIAPGSVLTRRTRDLFYSPDKKPVADSLLSHVPLGRPAEPHEIASAALFLASRDSSYVTGSVLTVDGGWTAGFARDW
jgi:3-oxoacyl-[acyl-carrier protein] reductase